jgi:hypothetical protein
MRFFVLKIHPPIHEVVGATDFLLAGGSTRGQAPRCPSCGKHIGMLPLVPPIRVELETWTNDFGDLAFGPGDELLLAERFWQIYQESGLKGFVFVASVEIIKLKLHGKVPNPVPRYLCCRACRNQAAVDETKSGLERERPWNCEKCRIGGIIKRIRSVVLEENSWSGEDVFVPRGLPGTILTSERFKNLCQEHQISNCLLIPAEEYSFDHYPSEEKNKA